MPIEKASFEASDFPRAPQCPMLAVELGLSEQDPHQATLTYSPNPCQDHTLNAILAPKVLACNFL